MGLHSIEGESHCCGSVVLCRFCDVSVCPQTSHLQSSVLVLVGKTGSGKSETGNTILGSDAFEAELSPSSVTKTCRKQTGHFNKRTVSVIDTPGIFDTSIDERSLKREIENCIKLSVPGPHVFLLVISLDVRFTDEEMKAVQWIKDIFGEEAARYTMVLFTRADMLKGKSVKTYIQQSPELTKVVSDCKAGFVGFDNTRKENRTQVADLLENIDRIVAVNGSHYTSAIYAEAQRKLEMEIWWIEMGDRLTTARNYLMETAAGAATAVAPAVVAAQEMAVATVRSAVMVVGAGAAKLIGAWMKPKPKTVTLL